VVDKYNNKMERDREDEMY